MIYPPISISHFPPKSFVYILMYLEKNITLAMDNWCCISVWKGCISSCIISLTFGNSSQLELLLQYFWEDPCWCRVSPYSLPIPFSFSEKIKLWLGCCAFPLIHQRHYQHVGKESKSLFLTLLLASPIEMSHQHPSLTFENIEKLKQTGFSLARWMSLKTWLNSGRYFTCNPVLLRIPI